MIPEALAEVEGLTRIEADPGVYFLCRGGVVVYVGQSTAVAARIRDHKDKTFDAAYFIRCEPEELRRVEAEWIAKLLPEYNGSGMPPEIRARKKRAAFARRVDSMMAGRNDRWANAWVPGVVPEAREVKKPPTKAEKRAFNKILRAAFVLHHAPKEAGQECNNGATSCPQSEA